MIAPRVLGATLVVAASLGAAPASAAPCEGMTIPQCASPLRYKLEHLCPPSKILTQEPFSC